MKKEGSAISGSIEMNYALLARAKGAVKMESVGLKHSSGISARKHWATNLGMKPSAKHAEVIAEIQRRMDAHLLIKDRTSYQAIAIAAGFASARGNDGTHRYACLGPSGTWASPLLSESVWDNEEDMWKGCCEEQELIQEPEKVEG